MASGFALPLDDDEEGNVQQQDNFSGIDDNYDDDDFDGQPEEDAILKKTAQEFSEKLKQLSESQRRLDD